jgi:hypothetical protein
VTATEEEAGGGEARGAVGGETVPTVEETAPGEVLAGEGAEEDITTRIIRIILPPSLGTGRNHPNHNHNQANFRLSRYGARSKIQMRMQMPNSASSAPTLLATTRLRPAIMSHVTSAHCA